MITETEAYCGLNDLASHASRGKTPRTEIMFGPPGRAYIYLVYGMYYCLNIVTEKKDYPAAVLIRGIIIDGVDYNKTNGPGKVCRVLKIDKTLNGKDITIANVGNRHACSSLRARACSQPLQIEDRGVIIKNSQIQKTPRIGVDYAGKFKDKKWRFLYLLDK